MNPLLGNIAFDPNNIISRHHQQTPGTKWYLAEHQNGHFVSNHPIAEHREIFCTGNLDQLTRDETTCSIQSLLESWEQIGMNALQHVGGEFALIIWDARRKKVWALRDHFGAQSLHYYSDKECFVFSQRATPLWHLPVAELQSLNQSRILDFIVDDLEHVSQTATFRENIHKLPLSGCVSWEGGTIQRHSYWKPIISPLDPTVTEEDVLERFQYLLCQSILNKVENSNGTALMTSGGLDSNTIHAAWKKTQHYSQENHQLVSLLPEKEHQTDSECDMVLNKVAKDTPLPHNIITPTQATRSISPIESFVHQLEDPFAIHALTGPAPCYCFTSNQGITHVMDGIDGDLLAGIPSAYWNYLWADGEIKNAVSECYYAHMQADESIIKALKSLIRMILGGDSSKLLQLKKSYKSQQIFDLKQAKIWLSDLKIRSTVFPADFITNRIQLLRERHPTTSCSSISDYMQQGLVSPMMGVGVDRYAEAARVFGIKPVHPLLDKSLAEFFLNLPWNYRSINGKEKQLFRLFLKQNNQSTIANQKKLSHVGFWFTFGFQKDYLQRNQSPKSECLDALNHYIDVSWINTAWKTAQRNLSIDGLGEDFFRLIMLGEWLSHKASNR